MKEKTHSIILKYLIKTISETNGISLVDTLELMLSSDLQEADSDAFASIQQFRTRIQMFQHNQLSIQELLAHPVAEALFDFFKLFPLKYHEEHTHLTGALTAEFIWPRLKPLLEGPHRALYEKKIIENYGPGGWPIESVEDVDRLIRVQDSDGFLVYLKNLFLPKLILVDKQAHIESAYHIAEELYKKYNVGMLRLKFTYSRATSNSADQIPGADSIASEDVVLGLYEGFKKFQKAHPDFRFILSPSFRKESHFFDSTTYKTRKDAIQAQVDEIVKMLDKHPFLNEVMTDVDTVGNEAELYRKEHFKEFERGFRKLQYRGFKIRSHHGETFHTLKKGIQAVDNAMNIWHIDTLEHGISLGINPNFYFHRLFQRVYAKNKAGQPILNKDPDYKELVELDWGPYRPVLDKLLMGTLLTEKDTTHFIKAKFHTAREVEHYQHDVLNRLIQKGVSLISLPSSNNKLTGQFEDYKDHPFSWWEKKGVSLGVGTDNYVTLNTNFIREMLIVLLTDSEDLKITKLLMVTTGESRRPYIAHLLWMMRKLRIEL
jgi:hypothetical protein